jgi:hypothetical protein
MNANEISLLIGIERDERKVKQQRGPLTTKQEEEGEETVGSIFGQDKLQKKIRVSG